MPLYEYECRACGKVTDVRHGFDEQNVEKCPDCGGDLARRFSAAGIVFKGSGFYVTDSRKGSSDGDGSSTKSTTSSKPESAKTEGPKTESGAASSGSSDAPPAGKGDTAAA